MMNLPSVVSSMSLADHGGQQLGGSGDLRAELQAAQRTQGSVAIQEQSVDQHLPGGRILPVTDWLAVA
jgi:hypothetical protein